MLLVLTLAACWRPAPYTPPPPPDDLEEPEEPAAEAETPEGVEVEPVEAPGEEAEGEAPPEEADDAPTQPDFPAYAARTVQAPVTIVDDWGKPLAVLGQPGWELEVRGEEPIRTRVWCATCAPPVEGWIQAHLVARSP